MKYIVKTSAILINKVLEISEEKFRELSLARQILINALSLEEEYDIAILNYLDFEQTLSENTISYMVYIGKYSYIDFYNTRSQLNAKLANFLTAIQMYQDQTKHQIKKCVPKNPQVSDIVQSYFSNEYDNNIEYRFMEEFRNYVQHQGLPIHNVSYQSHLTSQDEDGMIEYSLDIRTNRDILEQDKAIKKDVLEQINEKVNLKQFIRVYIECISNVHESVRSLINHNAEKSRELIDEIRNTYATNVDTNLMGLSAFIIDDDNNRTEEIPLLLDWDDIRKELIRKNRKLQNLKKCYATGATLKKD